MSNPTGKSGFTPRSGMPAFGTFGSHQASASLLLDRSNPGLRRSTPDSEALASSDDEADLAKMSVSHTTKNKTTRRKSWLNDVSSVGSNRKSSMTGAYSPNPSNPGTPAVEQSSWTSVSASTPNAWSNPSTASAWSGIWSQDARRDPPSRLQEHTSTSNDHTIPFHIPLQPTPKTYRSQSYSVGQVDLGMGGDMMRNKFTGQFPQLQRRSSRTSGATGSDGGGLGRVKEVDDDEEGEQEEVEAGELNRSQARMIEKLEKENAQLRQAAQFRESNLGSSPTLPSSELGIKSNRIRSNLLEGVGQAAEGFTGVATGPYSSHGSIQRRYSEHTASYADRHLQSQSEARNSDKKAQWQTSLGFGSIPEAPQSRRHSFVDVHTRQGSLSSNETMERGLHPDIMAERRENGGLYHVLSRSATQTEDRELAHLLKLLLEVPLEHLKKVVYSYHHFDVAAYFNVDEQTRRMAEASVMQQQSQVASNPYSTGHNVGPYNTSTTQPLYIVNFKCCRSDVFYIQEGTGLQVSVGDLVIVEADRGTDLGTVQHIQVSWDDARGFKEYYAEEHYKWLMMFSNQSRNGGPNVVNPNGPQGKMGSAVGGMGPPGHHGAHDTGHSDLKPKMIKRLAQNHEVQALKDKEGNEARAKRVCQQKVVEHRLNMEILDAEFQMDSKKLTFYYFADSYINFNSLVTDLFKIYKTRIWMSAINPASFQTPTSSLGLTPAFPGVASSTGHENAGGRRRHFKPAMANTYESTFEAERPFEISHPIRSPYFGQFHPMANAGPQAGFVPGMPAPLDPFSQYYPQPYQMLNPTATAFASNRQEYRNRSPNHGPDDGWTNRFHGLSLGS